MTTCHLNIGSGFNFRALTYPFRIILSLARKWITERQLIHGYDVSYQDGSEKYMKWVMQSIWCAAVYVSHTPITLRMYPKCFLNIYKLFIKYFILFPEQLDERYRTRNGVTNSIFKIVK